MLDSHEPCFHVEYRKSFLYIFGYWQTLTYTETENSDDIPLEFKTLEEAIEFISYICEKDLVD